MEGGIRDRKNWAMILGVAAAYALCAAIAISFTRLSANVALLWIANAPLLAALLTRPVAERPWLLTGCFIASLGCTAIFSPYGELAPMFAIANVGEAWLACRWLRRLGGNAPQFASPRALGLFVAVAGIAAPLASGLVPVLALLFFQGAAPHIVWSNWLVGHGLGALIGTPVALLAIGGASYREHGGRHSLPQVMASAALLLGVTALCFGQDGLPLLFLTVLPLVLVTLMFRFAGAALGIFAIAAIGAVFTVSGHGPIQLMASSQAFHLQFFQFYLAVLSLTALTFAAMIAEKDRLARAVADSEARYRLIAEYASDAVLVLDRAGDVLFASPAVREIGGYDPDQVVGQSSFSIIDESDRARVRQLHAMTLAEPSRVHRGDFRARTIAGVVNWIEATSRAVTDAQGEATSVVVIARDLSQRKAREADLERQANTDSMTGVLNRRAFRKRLAEVSQGGGAGGVVALLDIDHFKQVNDRFGHEAGDAALLTFADLMRGKLRSVDTIGRLGGEEFAVLFPGLRSAEALAACERVREALAGTWITTAHGCFGITVSIGLAPLTPGLTPEAILRQSDAALYRAKAMGRNRSEMAES